MEDGPHVAGTRRQSDDKTIDKHLKHKSIESKLEQKKSASNLNIRSTVCTAAYWHIELRLTWLSGGSLLAQLSIPEAVELRLGSSISTTCNTYAGKLRFTYVAIVCTYIYIEIVWTYAVFRIRIPFLRIRIQIFSPYGSGFQIGIQVKKTHYFQRQ